MLFNRREREQYEAEDPELGLISYYLLGLIWGKPQTQWTSFKSIYNHQPKYNNQPSTTSIRDYTKELICRGGDHSADPSSPPPLSTPEPKRYTEQPRLRMTWRLAEKTLYTQDIKKTQWNSSRAELWSDRDPHPMWPIPSCYAMREVHQEDGFSLTLWETESVSLRVNLTHWPAHSTHGPTTQEGALNPHREHLTLGTKED